MNKIEASVRPTIAKLICRNYPIVRKRPPISFFFDDVRNKNCDPELMKTIYEAKRSKKVNTPLRSIWKILDATHKMKYYELAKLDETRYREQTSLWVSKVASIVGTEDQPELEQLNNLAPDPIKTEIESALLMSKYQKRYGLLMEADSTRKLIKDLIKQTEQLSMSTSKDQIVEALSNTQQSVIARPIRPACPFVIFMRQNIYNLRRLHAKKFPNEKSFFKIVSREWANLSPKKKQLYTNIYEKRYKEYSDAMQKFIGDQETDDRGHNLNSKIAKARSNLSLNIRRKLRASDIVPLGTRNPFIFFFKEHGHLRKRGKSKDYDAIVNAYMNLSDEEKARYRKMFEEDSIRYDGEKKRYLSIIVKLIEVMKKHSVEH